MYGFVPLPARPNNFGNLSVYGGILAALEPREDIRGALDYWSQGGNGLAMLAARYGLDGVQGFEPDAESRASCSRYFPALKRRLIDDLGQVSLPGGSRERAMIALNSFPSEGAYPLMVAAERVGVAILYFLSWNPVYLDFAGIPAREFDLPQDDVRMNCGLDDDWPALGVAGYVSEGRFFKDDPGRCVEAWLWQVVFS